MNDLISRQAAIDALDGEITVTGRANAEAVRGYARLVADRIKRLPSAEPERKKGEWIEVQFKTFPYNRIGKARKCSLCGKRKDKYVRWDYCPCCGADMRGEQE